MVSKRRATSRSTRLRALSPLRFSIIGLAILILPKIGMRVACSMVKSASPAAICADQPLPTVILIIGWVAIAAGLLGVAYKLSRSANRGRQS